MTARPKVRPVGSAKVRVPRVPRNPLPQSLRSLCLQRALMAADWYVASQVRMAKPYWDANVGRLLYNYHVPSRTAVLGIDWTQARGSFVLLSAYAATGDRGYLEAARVAMAYCDCLQILDARRGEQFGAMHEEIPTSTYCHVRDAAEAAEGYVRLHQWTAEPDPLQRAEAYGRWQLERGSRDGLPMCTFRLDGGPHATATHTFSVGAAKLFNVLYDATGRRSWLTRGTEPMLRFLIERCQQSDGGLAHGPGESDARMFNDDGCGVALLGGYVRTGRRQYLDAALALGEWTLSVAPPFPRHCAFASMAVFLADLWRLTGDGDYLDWIAAHIQGWLFDRQVTDGDDPRARGGFRGEDEPVAGYIPGTDAMDYVNTRNTCYAALTCFKLAGAAWPSGYTAFA
jgi:hypothetical protein